MPPSSKISHSRMPPSSKISHSRMRPSSRISSSRPQASSRCNLRPTPPLRLWLMGKKRGNRKFRFCLLMGMRKTALRLSLSFQAWGMMKDLRKKTMRNVNWPTQTIRRRWRIRTCSESKSGTITRPRVK